MFRPGADSPGAGRGRRCAVTGSNVPIRGKKGMVQAMMGSAKSRLFAVLAAFCLLAGGIPAAADEAGAAGEPSDITADGESYYAYYTRYCGTPMAVNELPFALGEGTLSEKGAGRLEYLGEDAVRLEPDGYIEWTFTVPEEARYTLDIRYAAAQDDGRDLTIGLQLDGQTPFTQAEATPLSRVWRDGPARQDSRGNDLIPEQEEIIAWQDTRLIDNSSYMTEPYALYLTAGPHTLRLYAGEEPLVLAQVVLGGEQEVPTYAQALAAYEQQGLAPAGEICLTQQGEDTTLKSHRTLYPVYDRSNASTVPNDPALIKRNVIGQSNWSQSGMWISYTIPDVPEDGLYCLTIKYRQNTQLGMSVFRNIYINNELPYEELCSVRFPFGFGWENLTIADEDGTPYYVYLKKGDNTIAFEATVGSWSDILQEADVLAAEMNDLYRRIIMVTSTNPDTYRDYFLEREIDGLQDILQELSDRLAALADRFDEVNGEKSSQSELLRRASEQMGEFAARPAEIPERLSRFQENIASLSEWLLTSQSQPLEIDYFMLHGTQAELPKPRGSFWENLKFGFLQFLAAFADDYDTMADYGDGTHSVITVWINDGRDQAQVLKDMINDGFTSETGIPVNVNLVQGGLIEATLSGNGPDVAVGVARGQPVNLASRNALASLDGFEGFTDVTGRFGSDALVPYSYRGSTYALPMTQYYLMGFYRTDIFEELGLTVPQTWEELFDVAAVLQRNNMTVGLPYTAITASAAVDAGVGAKDLFPTLLMQYGGSYYNDDLSATELDSAQALEAFKTWTNFYTKYGFDLSYDFNTRFRTGEMPFAIAAYTMYGTLSAAAPEIRGQWEMTLVPGVLNEETGEIDRAGGASGSAVVMFDKAEDKEACWKFMEWITRADVQAEFGNRIESQLGPAARYATANLEAFEELGWSRQELAVLSAQRKFIREVPELPGSYFTSRCMDNAFRDVLYNNRNPRAALEKENDTINREILRKREELGY